MEEKRCSQALHRMHLFVGLNLRRECFFLWRPWRFWGGFYYLIKQCALKFRSSLSPHRREWWNGKSDGGCGPLTGIFPALYTSLIQSQSSYEHRSITDPPNSVRPTNFRHWRHPLFALRATSKSFPNLYSVTNSNDTVESLRDTDNRSFVYREPTQKQTSVKVLQLWTVLISWCLEHSQYLWM